jgi:hypothetical protein
MPSRGKAVRRSNRKPQPVAQSAPEMTVADYFKEKLGWKPSLRPFHTSANRQCGSCLEIKPGSEFDVPVTPGCPWLNVCREWRLGRIVQTKRVVVTRVHNVRLPIARAEEDVIRVIAASPHLYPQNLISDAVAKRVVIPDNTIGGLDVNFVRVVCHASEASEASY